MITPQQALVRLIEQREIFYDEMLSLMRQIMGGEVPPSMIAAILIGLRVKKETIGEISAAAFVMREFASKVPVTQRDHLVDTCGTGGDAAHLDGKRAGCRSRRSKGSQTWREISVVNLRFCGRVGGFGG